MLPEKRFSPMKKSMWIILPITLLLTSPVQAATELLRDAMVRQIVVSDLYTGCAVQLSKSVGLVSCTYPDYVHFDCDATFQSTAKESGNKFSAAQLAYVMGRTVTVMVSENVDDGVCFADTVFVNTQ